MRSTRASLVPADVGVVQRCTGRTLVQGTRLCLRASSSARTISDGATCCVPAGTFICSGPVYTNGNVVEFSERDTLETFGPNNAFLNYSIRSLDSSFTENEVYTRQPGACGRWSGATMHRSDVGAGDQVVFESLFFSQDYKRWCDLLRACGNFHLQRPSLHE